LNNSHFLFYPSFISLSQLLTSLIEKEWAAEDKDREKQLMAELVTIIEQRNQIVNSIDLDRQR